MTHSIVSPVGVPWVEVFRAIRLYRDSRWRAPARLPDCQ